MSMKSLNSDGSDNYDSIQFHQYFLTISLFHFVFARPVAVTQALRPVLGNTVRIRLFARY